MIHSCFFMVQSMWHMCRFIPHKYNFTKQEVSIDFDKVKNIAEGKFGLIVTMKTGERYKLVH